MRDCLLYNYFQIWFSCQRKGGLRKIYKIIGNGWKKFISNNDFSFSKTAHPFLLFVEFSFKIIRFFLYFFRGYLFLINTWRKWQLFLEKVETLGSKSPQQSQKGTSCSSHLLKTSFKENYKLFFINLTQSSSGRSTSNIKAEILAGFWDLMITIFQRRRFPAAFPTTHSYRTPPGRLPGSVFSGIPLHSSRNWSGWRRPPERRPERAPANSSHCG